MKSETWNDNSAHGAGRAIMACCNWVIRNKRAPFNTITESPLAGFKKVKAVARDFYLEPDDWKRLIESKHVDDCLRDAIWFMRLTGCRPSEMRTACKRHFKPAVPALVFAPAEWKNGKKLKTDRVIRLSGESLVMVQKLSMKHPDGPLFRNKVGKPWTKDTLARRFARLRVKLGLPELVPYTVRHTYATESAGKVDSLLLAELMGTSMAMLESVYSKARKRADLMGEAAAKAIQGLA